MTRSSIALGLMVAPASQAAAQSRCVPGTGIRVLIYGRGHAFMISAPADWIATAGFSNQTAPALLTRTGETWREAPAVMYVNTSVLDSGQVTSVKATMRGDSLQIVARYPAIRVENLSPVQTADGGRVFVRKFRGAEYGSIDSSPTWTSGRSHRRSFCRREPSRNPRRRCQLFARWRSRTAMWQRAYRRAFRAVPLDELL